MTIKHIGMIKFKTNITETEKNEFYKKLENLKTKIPGIISFERFKNISEENLDKGFKEGFKVIFKDEAARTAYLDDEDHKKIAAEVVELIEKVPDDIFVYDKKSQNKKLTTRSFCQGVTQLLDDYAREDVKLTIDELNSIKNHIEARLDLERKNPQPKTIINSEFGLSKGTISIDLNQTKSLEKLLERIENFILKLQSNSSSLKF